MKLNAGGVVAAFVVLAIRGALLWLIIPIGTLFWIVTLQGLGKTPVSLGAFLGWLDNNLAFRLVRGPLSPLFPTAPVKWVPARERAKVTHRIGVDLSL